MNIPFRLVHCSVWGLSHSKRLPAQIQPRGPQPPGEMAQDQHRNLQLKRVALVCPSSVKPVRAFYHSFWTYFQVWQGAVAGT